MRRDVLDLRAFYAAPLGRAARTMLTRKVEEAWGDTRGLDVLGLGYATPFLDAARANALGWSAFQKGEHADKDHEGGADVASNGFKQRRPPLSYDNEGQHIAKSVRTGEPIL